MKGKIKKTISIVAELTAFFTQPLFAVSIPASLAHLGVLFPLAASNRLLTLTAVEANFKHHGSFGLTHINEIHGGVRVDGHIRLVNVLN